MFFIQSKRSVSCWKSCCVRASAASNLDLRLLVRMESAAFPCQWNQLIRDYRQESAQPLSLGAQPEPPGGPRYPHLSTPSRTQTAIALGWSSVVLVICLSSVVLVIRLSCSSAFWKAWLGLLHLQLLSVHLKSLFCRCFTPR